MVRYILREEWTGTVRRVRSGITYYDEHLLLKGNSLVFSYHVSSNMKRTLKSPLLIPCSYLNSDTSVDL